MGLGGVISGGGEGLGVGLVTGFQHITLFSGVEKTNYNQSSEK